MMPSLPIFSISNSGSTSIWARRVLIRPKNSIEDRSSSTTIHERSSTAWLRFFIKKQASRHRQ